jgi:hypothetical protein
MARPTTDRATLKNAPTRERARLAVPQPTTNFGIYTAGSLLFHQKEEEPNLKKRWFFVHHFKESSKYVHNK